MARVTVEDCLERVPNRFALTVLAAKRAPALSEGKARPLVECENKEAVTALREVAAGKVRFAEDVDAVLREFIDEEKHQYRVTSAGSGYIEAINLAGLSDDEDEDVLLADAEAELEELPSDPALLGKKAKAELDGEDIVEEDEDPPEDDDVDDLGDVGEGVEDLPVADDPEAEG